MFATLRFDPQDPYPDSDGQPMADNTEQFSWIVKVKENLEILFAEQEDVFVAGDLLWYPVPDRQKSGPVAPDVMVAFGRPKGYRGSYKQWEEGNIPPQVVFEILSPSNSQEEMLLKRQFYQDFGVEEFYIYDPDRNRLEIYLRQQNKLKRVAHIKGWVSPRLGIRFELAENTLRLYYPDNRPFLSPVELSKLAEQQRQRAETAEQRAEQEHQRAEQECQRAEQERQRAEAAEAELARLRALLAQK